MSLSVTAVNVMPLWLLKGSQNTEYLSSMGVFKVIDDQMSAK